MYDYLLITNVYNIKAIQQMIGKDYTTEGNFKQCLSQYNVHVYIDVSTAAVFNQIKCQDNFSPR